MCSSPSGLNAGFCRPSEKLQRSAHSSSRVTATRAASASASRLRAFQLAGPRASAGGHGPEPATPSAASSAAAAAAEGASAAGARSTPASAERCSSSIARARGRVHLEVVALPAAPAVRAQRPQTRSSSAVSRHARHAIAAADHAARLEPPADAQAELGQQGRRRRRRRGVVLHDARPCDRGQYSPSSSSCL